MNAPIMYAGNDDGSLSGVGRSERSVLRKADWVYRLLRGSSGSSNSLLPAMLCDYNLDVLVRITSLPQSCKATRWPTLNVGALISSILCVSSKHVRRKTLAAVLKIFNHRQHRHPALAASSSLVQAYGITPYAVCRPDSCSC